MTTESIIFALFSMASLAAGLFGAPWSEIVCFVWFGMCLIATGSSLYSKDDDNATQ